MRDFQYANHHRRNSSTAAAVLSRYPAGSDYMGTEEQPISRSASLFSTDLDLHSTRSDRF